MSEAIKTNDNPYFDDYQTRSPFPPIYILCVALSLVFVIVSCVQVYHKNNVVKKVESTYIELKIDGDQLVGKEGTKSISFSIPNFIDESATSIWYNEKDDEIITNIQLQNRYKAVMWKWLRIGSILLFLLALIAPVVVYKLLHPIVRVPITGAYQSAKFGYTIWMVEANTLYCLARDYLPSLKQISMLDAKKYILKLESDEHTKIYKIRSITEFELTGSTTEFFCEAIDLNNDANNYISDIRLYFNVDQTDANKVISFVDSNWFYNKL